MPLNTTIALTTVENVELMLGLDEGVYTPQIELSINMYSAFLEAATGRRLKSRTYTDYRLSGDGSQYLYFPEYPLTSVSSLLVYDSLDTVYSTIDTSLRTQFVFDSLTGRIDILETIFLSGYENIKLTAVAGITDLSELALLEQAVLSLIANNNPSGPMHNSQYKSERLGAYSYTVGSTTSLPHEIQTVISYFARM